jgi:hypothetical protein
MTVYCTTFLRSLYWRWYFRRHGNTPAPGEVEWAISKYDHRPRILKVMLLYIYGQSLEEIAVNMECTRERIRQILNKGVRSARLACK